MEGSFIVRRGGLLAGQHREPGDVIEATDEALTTVTHTALSALLEQGYLEHVTPLTTTAEERLARVEASVERLVELVDQLVAGRAPARAPARAKKP